MAVERLVHDSWADFPCANKLSDCVMIDSFNLVSPQAHPPSLWHGRRGTCSQQPSFCMAGMALMTESWLWWCGLVGRRGTCQHGRSICVAGVATYGTGPVALAELVQGWTSDSS